MVNFICIALSSERVKGDDNILDMDVVSQSGYNTCSFITQSNLYHCIGCHPLRPVKALGKCIYVFHTVIGPSIDVDIDIF